MNAPDEMDIDDGAGTGEQIDIDSAPVSRPSIFEAVRTDYPLPEREPLDGPTTLHNSSESAHHVCVPHVWLQEPKVRYLEKADNFLDSHEFSALKSEKLPREDPSMLYHRSEADSSRTLDGSMIKLLHLVIHDGYAEMDGRTLNMDGQAQARRSHKVDDDGELKEIISIPDFETECELESADGVKKKSVLITEMKYPNLLPTVSLQQLIKLSAYEQIRDQCIHQQNAAAVLQRDLERAREQRQNQSLSAENINLASSPPREDWRARTAAVSPPVPSRVRPQALGKDPPLGFPKNLLECFHQGVTYGVCHNADRVALADYTALAILVFKLNKTLSDVERILAGPGRTASALTTTGSDQRRTLLGSQLASIEGEFFLSY
ncbi:hypothetical protein CGLO_06732 [Colletotrichum gloeosporioides Cg-14]|uniref:Uncharacterized protein n=1 Tax=Colletotrichum gloeosporioides (strain Cg-14) TaxID=1237896 RepID=T0LYK3_COLGC|nr:hypothetical protein CGLO_06732 [Colletotrichum gloeosporioides Cg-14]